MYIGAVAVLPTCVRPGLDCALRDSHSESFWADCCRRAKAASRRCAR